MESKVEKTKQSVPKDNFWERMTRYWWLMPLALLLFFFIDTLLVFISEYYMWAYDVGLVMEWITILAILAVGVLTIIIIVRDFIRKSYKHAVICLLVSVLGVVVLYAWSCYYGKVAGSTPTYYAEKHPIPPDLEYNIPEDIPCYVSLPNRDSIVTECDTNSWLMLYGNTGLYYWDFYYPALPDGILYLRLFEVTKNEPLSYEQIKTKTKTYVSNHTAFGHIKHNQEYLFTIYEGDFERYYAARVEVWHRDTVTHQERKLVEKIYRVDGWMR